MKYLLILCILMISNTVLAQTPVVQYNLVVIQNATPSQCQASWNGRPNQEDVARTGAGQDYGLSGPVVRSCTECALVSSNQSQDCVCKTCYDYFQ
jgi:hypothetical protein